MTKSGRPIPLCSSRFAGASDPFGHLPGGREYPRETREGPSEQHEQYQGNSGPPVNSEWLRWPLFKDGPTPAPKPTPMCESGRIKLRGGEKWRVLVRSFPIRPLKIHP
jgi:hypothetical protein